MSKRMPLIALLVFISLLFGCNVDVVKTQFTDTTTKVQVDFTMLASEKKLPENFHEIAFNEDTSPLLVKKAVDQSELEETWRLYELEQNMPDVDFNENVVFFIGVYESGSCPLEIKSVELNGDHTTMTIPLSVPNELSGPDVACTADASPKTFVIQLEKKLTEKLNGLVINDTTVPFD